MTTFTLRTARSRGLMLAIGLAIAVETAALHLLLVRRHPVFAWLLTASSLSIIAWLVADYRRLGDSALRIDALAVHLDIGLRFRASVAHDRIATAITPTWRDLPAPGAGFLNATKPAEPNVLLTFRDPVPIRVMGMVSRPVHQLGIRLDDPAAFLAALRAAAPRAAAPRDAPPPDE